MYAILISFALAIYTIILVDYSYLYQEISTNNDLLTSVQALYVAEGAIESAVSSIGDKDLTLSNLTFSGEAQQERNKSNRAFLEHANGSESFYFDRKLDLNANFIPAFSDGELKKGASEVQVKNISALDQSSYCATEPKSAKSFVLREIASETNFNEIHFDFNQGDQASELVFDIFVFPKEGEQINFQNFEVLKNNPKSSSVKRLSINTRDSSTNGLAFEAGSPFKVEVGKTDEDYKKSLIISGFQPLENNYILHFQTLDNQLTYFKLSAFYQGVPVVLPGLMQTIDVIGATSTGLYQRIKFQREAEEGLSPGLNFVHFSQEDIVK